MDNTATVPLLITDDEFVSSETQGVDDLLSEFDAELEAAGKLA